MHKAIPFSPATGGMQQMLYNMGSYGCYFLSLMYYFFRRELSVEELVSVWRNAIKSKAINFDGYVYDPIKLGVIAREIVKDPNALKPTTALKFESSTLKDARDTDLETCIACWQRAGENACHFTVVKGDNTGTFDMVYDPWGAEDGSPSGSRSAIVNGGKLVSIRVFR